MLDRVVGVEQPDSDDAHVLASTEAEHNLDPIRSNDLGVVVEKKQEVALCLLRPEVHELREVELVRPALDADYVRVALHERVVVLEGLRFGAVVLDDHDLVVVVGRLVENGLDAGVQNLDVVHGGDDDRDERVVLWDVIDDTIGERSSGLGDRRMNAETVEVLPNGANPRVRGVRLAARVCCRGGCTHTPMVERSSDVVDVSGLLDCAKGEIVVLRAIIGGGVGLDLVEQGLSDREHMTDVV